MFIVSEKIRKRRKDDIESIIYSRDVSRDTSLLYIEKENKLVLISFLKPVIDQNRFTET